MPANDLRPHKFDGCWCKPTVDPETEGGPLESIVHNSMDSREDSGARDPIDQSALAAAVAKWLVTMSDEADIALEAAMLEQGVISPDDIVETLRSDHGRTVFVALAGGDRFHMADDGTIF